MVPRSIEPDLPPQPEIEIIGLSLLGPPPIGQIHLEWQPGLNVLYGLNGAGKSAILRGIHRTLSGFSGAGHGMLHLRVLDPDQAFDPNYSSLATDLFVAMHEAVVESLFGPLGQHIFYEGGIEDLWSGFLDFTGSSTVGEACERAVRLLPPGDTLLSNVASDLAASNTFTLLASGDTSPSFTVHASIPAGDSSESAQALRDEALMTWDETVRRLEAGDHRDVLGRSVGSMLAANPPGWVPIPWIAIGELRRSYWPVVTEQTAQLEDITNGLLDNAVERGSAPNSAQSSQNRHSQIQELIGLISPAANKYLNLLLENAPTLELRYDPDHNELGTSSLSWVARDRPSGATVPLNSLSRAEQRWASFSAHLALTDQHPMRSALGHGDSKVRQEFPGIAVVDEPESALHRRAVRRLAKGLAKLSSDTSPAFVATHSPEFLNRRDARLHHVSRNASGFSVLRSWLEGTGPSVDSIAEGLGLDRSDLIQLVRVFLMVEGDHDRAAFETLLKDELDEQRVQVVPLRGTRYVASQILENAVMLGMSDATIVVVFDNIRDPERLMAAWQQVIQRTDASAEDPCDILDRAVLGDRTGEENEALSFLKRALEKGLGSRLRFVGMSQRDIEFYFPAQRFGAERDTDWRTLQAEWEIQPANVRKGASFKSWLRDHKHVSVTTETVRAAALSSDEIPGDFTRVLDVIRSLA